MRHYGLSLAKSGRDRHDRYDRERKSPQFLNHDFSFFPDDGNVTYAPAVDL
jgi:hypothetical protein